MKLTDRCIDTCQFSPPAAHRGELRVELALRHGGIAEAMLRYERVGQEGAPFLLVAGGISAGRHAISSAEFPEAGWWQSQAVSFAGVQSLSIDWVGADGTLDRPIDPADQAAAIARLLDHLGVERLAGIVGASYGAMVGLHFAALYPDRCGAILSISASASPHPYASASRALQRRALALGDDAEGIALARAMAMLTYRTPAEFADRFATPPSVEGGRVRVAAEDYLDAQGERHAKRMSATAYRRLSESIDLHRIDPTAIRVAATFVAVDSDALVAAEDVEALARAIPGAAFHRISSRYGHDAFLKEGAAIALILSNFLTLEPAR